MDTYSRVIVDRQSQVIDKYYASLADRLKITDQFLNTLNQCLNNREKDILTSEKVPRSERVNKLLDIVKRKHLFYELYNALVATRQVHLAECLRSEDSNLPDPVASIKNVTNIVIHSPTTESIEANRKFYEAEIHSFSGVPETCGVIENLSVDSVDLPVEATIRDFFDSDTMYRNFTKPKGRALIINNRNFLVNGGLPDRLGTDVDRTNMFTLLTSLGYEVKVKENLRCYEIAQAMCRFASKGHSSYDSAVIVILSHGKNGKIYGTDCQEIDIEKLVSALNSANCPSLSGKPKIFFIQACRGEKYDLGRDFADCVENHSADSGDGNVVKKLAAKVTQLDLADAYTIRKTPTEADILIAFATTPGYVSWRNSLHGSWFVQSICEVFSKKAKTADILHLLTEVCRLVSQRVSSSDHVQIPEPCSRLRKLFYFFPGISVDFDHQLLN